MQIRKARADDQEQLIRLIAKFRVTLARLRGRTSKPDLDAARRELAEYQSPGYPVFVAESDDSKIVGYLVCRVDGNVVQRILNRPADQTRRTAGLSVCLSISQLVYRRICYRRFFITW